MNPPSIKLILLNRSTQYSRKASKAFGAIFDEIKKHANRQLNDEPQARGSRTDYFFDIPDAYSVAIVLRILGRQLRCFQPKSLGTQ